MSKEMGPKERAQREMREANFAARNAKKPTAADLRNKIAKIKAAPRKGGGRGR